MGCARSANSGCTWQHDGGAAKKFSSFVDCFTKSSPNEVHVKKLENEGVRGGWIHFTHARDRVSIDPRVPARPGRSTSSFRGPGGLAFACTKPEAP